MILTFVWLRLVTCISIQALYKLFLKGPRKTCHSPHHLSRVDFRNLDLTGANYCAQNSLLLKDCFSIVFAKVLS
ncbi:hypothetical protein FPQ18DRAFT_357707 [Pyronema domesticum]|nr:hypothetical protein FPQ18DRAFT_357707 [Pyronema domesticum]